MNAWQVFSARFPSSLIAKIDRARGPTRSRSEFIRAAITAALEAEGVPIENADRYVPDRTGVGGRPTHKGRGDLPRQNAALSSPSSTPAIDPADPKALFDLALPFVKKRWQEAGLEPQPKKKSTQPSPCTSPLRRGIGRQTNPSQQAPAPVRVDGDPSGPSAS